MTQITQTQKMRRCAFSQRTSELPWERTETIQLNRRHGDEDDEHNGFTKEYRGNLIRRDEMLNELLFTFLRGSMYLNIAQFMVIVYLLYKIMS